MGPKQPRSTVLTEQEEAMIVAFRTKTMLSLDDCLYVLQETIPHLTRASLHRCFKRHGVNRLPQSESKPAKKRFKAYPIGYFHLDICHLRTDEGKLYLFVAIDRTSKLAYAELLESYKRADACAFLQRLIAAVPYKIHTILTDNGNRFTQPANTKRRSKQGFDTICDAHDIQHRLTKPYHPWTNGQMNECFGPSKSRPYIAISTKRTRSCVSTLKPSSRPTTLPNGSRRCRGDLHMNSSATNGVKIRTSFTDNHTTLLRD